MSIPGPNSYLNRMFKHGDGSCDESTPVGNKHTQLFPTVVGNKQILLFSTPVGNGHCGRIYDALVFFIGDLL